MNGLLAADAGPARDALVGQNFPWYDARADRVVPVLPEPDWEGGAALGKAGDWLDGIFKPVGDWFRGMNGWKAPGLGIGAGDLVAVGLALLLLTLVLVLLLELLRRYRPAPDARTLGGPDGPDGSPCRVEGLPIAGSIDLTDPWARARELREAGDYAGALVYLFAHQLLTLSRLGHLRLVPGRTGRQLVRSVKDRAFRGPVEPTLRLFEAYYYGHRPPAPAAFEAVWVLAEDFERAAAGGGRA